MSMNCLNGHPMTKLTESPFLKSHNMNTIKCFRCAQDIEVSQQSPCYTCLHCTFNICNLCSDNQENFDFKDDYEFDADCNEATESE